MSKIKSIKINKFRQLENVCENNIDLINELYGSNGSGKTSFISFITWMIYGETLDYGKNDDMNIDTYKPYELISGDIVIEKNNLEYKITREYGYNEEGKKTQNFFVNDRKVSRQDEYYNKINELFNLESLSNLKIKNFNLQRALSDPYYLPNNETQFRELISAILNVNSYETIINNNSKYEKIQKDYAYQDYDYDKCKDYYRQQINLFEKQIEMTENAINNCKENEKYNEEEHKAIKNKYDSLIELLGTNNNDLREKGNQLNDLYSKLMASKKNDIDNRPLTEDEEEFNKLKKEYNSLLSEYELKVNENNKIKSKNSIIDSDIKYYEDLLGKAKSSTFQEIRCPNCDILVNEKDYQDFNEHKVEKIKALNKQISDLKLEKKSLNDLSKYEETLQNNISRLNDLNSRYSGKTVEYKSEETKSLENEYNALNLTFEELKENNHKKNEEINQEIQELTKKLNLMNYLITKELELNKNINYKKELLQEKSVYELKLNLLEQFRNEEINLIKSKTKEIFGDDFEFEMLVKNKSNDKYKKVCYATIDGLEHNKSNTAKYLRLSISLMEKLKKYIGGCTIPVVFDIADNIGKTSRKEIFKLIENSQIFYTRISDDDNVKRTLNTISGEN